MKTAYLRFYEELNDLLPQEKRKVAFPVTFSDNPSVKSLIEGEGVPHPEVDMILINGKPVPFAEKVQDGDHVSVYPVFESLDISPVNVTRLRPLREPRFILDVHLGKLARYLRMAGFDSLYSNDRGDAEIASISIDQKRAILTRDRKLLMRKGIVRGYWVRSINPAEQLSEVIMRFDLKLSVNLFRRCPKCNGDLEPVGENEAMAQLHGYQFLPGTSFSRCSECAHLYWNGSHCKRFSEVIDRILRELC